MHFISVYIYTKTEIKCLYTQQLTAVPSNNHQMETTESLIFLKSHTQCSCFHNALLLVSVAILCLYVKTRISQASSWKTLNSSFIWNPHFRFNKLMKSISWFRWSNHYQSDIDSIRDLLMFLSIHNTLDWDSGE